MKMSFIDIFMEGGHANSLGRSAEVMDTVLEDKSRLAELYECICHDDAWVRMRAIDSIEKVCRVHPDWISPYIDKMLSELTKSTQASILWHLAQIFGEVVLDDNQKEQAIKWLETLLSSKDVDWIVSANSMKTLSQFTRDDFFPTSRLVSLLKVQKGHKSNAVKKRANKLLVEFT
jgi:hypothetical protein